MDIDDEMVVLFEMKQLCKLYIDMISDLPAQNRGENVVISHAIKMLASINKRITHFCQHTIVEDLIEVGESIKRVCYCTKCEANF